MNKTRLQFTGQVPDGTYFDDFGTGNQMLAAIVGAAAWWQNHFEQRSEVEDGSDKSAEQALIRLLVEFQAFAMDYYLYLVKGEPLADSDMQRELDSAVRSLQREWEVLSRVCEQRQIGQYQRVLAAADTDARMYYARYRGSKRTFDGKPLEPVTYLGKAFEIIRSPVYLFPFVSIPFYVLNNPNRWLAIAHEIGHHIYWSSLDYPANRQAQKLLKQTLLNTLIVNLEDIDEFQEAAQLVQIWTRWIEELFADIMGTMLAGPAYAVSALDIMEERGSDLDALTFDDGEHPIPYLRPLIVLTTLQWIAEKSDSPPILDQLIQQLERRWAVAIADQRSNIEDRRHPLTGHKMREIEVPIARIVRSILDGHGQGTWLVTHGETGRVESVALGDLVDFQAWVYAERTLDRLRMEMEAEEGRVRGLSDQSEFADRVLRDLEEGFLPSGESLLFNQFKTQLEAEAEFGPQDVRLAMLLLHADRGAFFSPCRQLWVHEVSVGRYAICNE